MGAYDAVSARIAEWAGFDAIWASGLAISAAHGVPDCSILTLTEFLAAGDVINQASELPVIADCDTGFGDINVLERAVRDYERTGIAAICIEDKQAPKRNSFRKDHTLADPQEFAAKIAAAKAAQRDPGLVVMARLESLIAGAGQRDALERAALYAQAGADAIVVHSKALSPEEVFEFAAEWHARDGQVPLVVIPTNYPQVTLDQLSAAGIGVVIYANQALRAAIAAMRSTLNAIATAGSSGAIEPTLASVDDVLTLVKSSEAEQRDAQFEVAVLEWRAAQRELVT
jgi:phosphoenolpyruvate phosphomutase